MLVKLGIEPRLGKMILKSFELQVFQVRANELKEQ